MMAAQDQKKTEFEEMRQLRKTMQVSMMSVFLRILNGNMSNKRQFMGKFCRTKACSSCTLASWACRALRVHRGPLY